MHYLLGLLNVAGKNIQPLSGPGAFLSGHTAVIVAQSHSTASNYNASGVYQGSATSSIVPPPPVSQFRHGRRAGTDIGLAEAAPGELPGGGPKRY